MFNIIEYPKVFIEGERLYPNTTEGLGLAIADGNSGWACCMMGEPPPDNFGKGMVCIEERIGTPCTPENLSELADNFLSSN